MSAEARCPIPALTVGDFRCRLVLGDNIRLRGLGDEQRQASARAPGNNSEAAALTLLRSNSTGSPFWEEVSLAMVTGLQLGLGEHGEQHTRILTCVDNVQVPYIGPVTCAAVSHQAGIADFLPNYHKASSHTLFHVVFSRPM